MELVGTTKGISRGGEAEAIDVVVVEMAGAADSELDVLVLVQ